MFNAYIMRFQFLNLFDIQGIPVETPCGKPFMYKYKFSYHGDGLSFYAVNLIFSDL